MFPRFDKAKQGVSAVAQQEASSHLALCKLSTCDLLQQQRHLAHEAMLKCQA